MTTYWFSSLWIPFCCSGVFCYVLRFISPTASLIFASHRHYIWQAHVHGSWICGRKLQHHDILLVFFFFFFLFFFARTHTSCSRDDSCDHLTMTKWNSFNCVCQDGKHERLPSPSVSQTWLHKMSYHPANLVSVILSIKTRTERTWSH